MSWLYLVFAGLLEVGWAYGLKKSEGFTKLLPSVFTVALMAVSFGLLAMALRRLPVGTAYAVWTGIGALGTAIVGMTVLGESKDLPKLLCLALILTGIVGLKVVTKG